MKKRLIQITLLLGWCVPWAFLGPWGDGIHRTMVGYGILIAGYSILYLLCRKTGNKRLILPGNILSFVFSVLFVRLTLAGEMEYYFKPFTSTQLTVLVCLTALGIQTVLLRRQKE